MSPTNGCSRTPRPSAPGSRRPAPSSSAAVSAASWPPPPAARSQPADRCSACCRASTRATPTSGSTSPCRPAWVKDATCWSCAARESSSRSAGRGGRSPRSRWPAGWTSRWSACTAGPSTVRTPATTWSSYRAPTKRSGQLLLGFLRRLSSGALGAVRHRLTAAGVGDRDEQPAEQAEVPDEPPALHLLLLLVLLRPERVTRRGIRNHRQRQRESGQPRHPAGGEQQPGTDLRAGDGLGDEGRVAEAERAGEGLRLLLAAVALAHRLEAGADERHTEQGAGKSSKHVRSRKKWAVRSPAFIPGRTGSTLAAGGDICESGRMPDGSAPDFAALLAFRTSLRRFNRWSEGQARAVGLTHAQHQLLLAIKGHDDDRGPTIGDAAAYLLLRHHSAVELVNRAQAGGLVERCRDEADARVVRLKLTPLGEERIVQLTQLHIDELAQLAPMLRHVIEGAAVPPQASEPPQPSGPPGPPGPRGPLESLG